MERPTKKSTPIFDTFYPSKKELDYLANNEMWDKLDERLKDKTTENAIRDIADRRKREIDHAVVRKLDPKELPLVPLDILEKIALHMDIRDVLTQSQTNSTFLILVANDKFWKKRFELDFPEVLYANPNFDPSSVIGTELYKNLPWRRYYIVVRYYMHRNVYPLLSAIFQYLSGCPYDVRESHPVRLERANKKFYFIISYNKLTNDFTRKVVERNTKRQIGQATNLSFKELLSYFNYDTTRYLSAFASEWQTLSSDYEILKSATGRDIRYPSERKAVVDRVFKIAHDISALKEEIARGYVKKEGNRVVIGNECIVCGEEANFIENTDMDRKFCNDTCQYTFYNK